MRFNTSMLKSRSSARNDLWRQMVSHGSGLSGPVFQHSDLMGGTPFGSGLMAVVSHGSGLPWQWSPMAVVSHGSVLLRVAALMAVVVSHDSGLSWQWSLMTVVSWQYCSLSMQVHCTQSLTVWYICGNHSYRSRGGYCIYHSWRTYVHLLVYSGGWQSAPSLSQAFYRSNLWPYCPSPRMADAGVTSDPTFGKLLIFILTAAPGFFSMFRSGVPCMWNVPVVRCSTTGECNWEKNIWELILYNVCVLSSIQEDLVIKATCGLVIWFVALYGLWL